jgi:hypothetical protein
MMYVRFLAAVAVMMFLAPVAPAQPARQTEAAPTSKLTGTSFGATPDRDLRPLVISNSSDYLAQLATQADPASQVSDVEVIFWRNAVKPQAVEAYQKLVTDNLSQGGYTYTVTGTQSTAGQTTTLFTVESNQQGRIIGFWQATPQGLFLNWGRSAGGAAAAPAPPPPAQAAEQPGGPAPAAGDKDAEIAALKRRLAEMEAGKTPAVTPEAAAAPATMAPALAPTNIPLRPLDQSALVVKAADGTPIVANKNGSGIDGIKLSQHDVAIVSPSMAVAPDGTIHVAFVEQHRTTYANAIYHRSSTDGGKTWTEAKNLSEDMPIVDVGRCQVLVDARNRVYVIWRSGLGKYDRVSGNPSGDARSNLWFRELEGGKWTRIKPIGETVTSETQWNSALSYFAALDAAGRVHVLWNVSPDKWHPELTVNHVHANGIGNGLVFQSILDGATAGKPREVFLPVIIPIPDYGPSCDSLDAMNGYVDAAGEAHFVTTFTTPKETAVWHLHFELIENGNAGQKTNFPELSFHGCKDIPTLLVDAKGRRHVIALYLAGEHPNIRDYLLGSDDEPTVIRAAVGLNGIIDGFQAYQGPGGRMVVIMQMNDTGERFAGDNFVSISTGDGKWSVPVNVTNNAGRQTFHNTETSAQSNVAVATSCLPGPGAVAFDRDGHLLLIMVKGEYKIVLATAFGVNTAGGDTITPTLRFLKF